MKKLVFLCTIISLLAAPLHAQQPSSGGTSYWGLFGAFSVGVVLSSIVWNVFAYKLDKENRALRAEQNRQNETIRNYRESDSRMADEIYQLRNNANYHNDQRQQLAGELGQQKEQNRITCELALNHIEKLHNQLNPAGDGPLADEEQNIHGPGEQE